MAEKNFQEPFLESNSIQPQVYLRMRTARDVWRRRFHILFSVTVITASVFSLISPCPTQKPSLDVSGSHVQEPYSPVTPYIKYVNKYINDDPESQIFTGKPGRELDEAWHELLEGTLIRYSATELKQANNATSVRHKNGGFVGGIGISHDLHCLKRIKQQLYPEYYYRNNMKAWKNMAPHIDHCVESLRQKLLCHADTAVYGLVWTTHTRFKPSSVVPQPHKCVDWSSLHDWMKEHAARVEDMEGPPSEP